MDFRRIPFQFSSTDPAKRQAELQKRFGLHTDTNQDKMHLDFENCGLMGFKPNEKSSASGSPRLQHRVPVFVEGDPEPMRSSVDSQGSPLPGRKPHVRVIPIEIEGEDTLTKRHRNLSGPTNSSADRPCQNGSTWLPEEFAPYVRPPVIDPKPATLPRERTIPIQVEGVQNKKAKTVPVQKPKSVSLKKETGSKHDLNASKVDKPVPEPKKALSGPVLSLKKIEGVLEKLKTYHSDVEKFTGTVKEKQYRYLDEMLTRLMLELDDIDTMGNEEVRLSRKAAIKQVQASIDLLETKVTRESSEEMPVEDNPVKPQDVEESKDEDVEMDMPSTNTENVMGCEDSTMPVVPDDGLAKLPADSTCDAEQPSEMKVEDVEMKNSVPEGQVVSMKPPEETTATTGDFQVMEVDENAECDTTEPVVTTADSPAEVKNKTVGESNVKTNVPVELCEGETSDAKETEQEPVVTLADSPVKVNKVDNKINVIPNDETLVLEVEASEPLQDLASAPETLIKSSHVSCEDSSNVVPDEPATTDHSDVTESKHSIEVPDKELVNS